MEQLLFLLLIGLIAILRWLFFGGGLKKIIESLQGDLQDTSKQGPQRTTPTVTRRQVNIPPNGETAEERQMRKFLEALGHPGESAAPPQPPSRPSPPPIRPAPAPQRRGPLPVPPVVEDNVLRRLQKEAERLKRRKEENDRRKAQSQNPPALPLPPLPVPAGKPEETAVGQYFGLEKFNRPDLAGAPLEPTAKQPAIFNVGGSREDLRRMILAHEILGPPKSLQRH